MSNASFPDWFVAVLLFLFCRILFLFRECSSSLSWWMFMRMAWGKLFSAPYTGFVSPKCPFSWLVSGSFMPQAGGSVALLIWKSDPSENKVETRVPASGPFCRVTGLALTLSVEEAHLSITGLSSRPHCVSFKVLSLVSCLGKRDIHGAATGLRHVLIQFPKKSIPSVWLT